MLHKAKQSCFALIVGIIFEALVLLSIIVISIIPISMAFFGSGIGIALITLTTIGFGFKLWTFLTAVGALQEVMLEMSDLQPEI